MISAPLGARLEAGDPYRYDGAMGSKVTEKDLFEIICRQSEQIDQLIARNNALQAENARLKKRIEELERRARKYAAPFSRETRTPDHKPPGRRPGEVPFAYKSPPTPQQVTETVQGATPNTCPRCGFTGPLIFTRQSTLGGAAMTSCRIVWTRSSATFT